MPKRRTVLLQESATPTTLAEARPTLLAEASGEGGRFRVQLIDSGWGSSGYYSPEVLAEAAAARVFAEGTHMYADHPRGDGAGLDAHGNRSVTDLWAVLASDATVSESGALEAEVQVFAPYRALVAEMASSIGLSIRATGTYEVGEADGRSGHLITSLDEGLSVDFVVAAGRGGRILEVVESARGEALTESVARTQLSEARNVGQWIESRLHLSLTQIADDMFGEGRLTREERIALSSAVGDGLQAFTASLEASSPQLYARDLWEDAPLVAESIPFDTAITRLLEAVPLRDDEPTGRAVSAWLNEAAPKAGLTNHVPVSPAGRSTTTESQGGTMPQIEEARLRQLEADAGRAAVLESERDAANAAREAAERTLAESTARTAARPVIAAVLAEGATPLPASTSARLTEALVAGAPLSDAGQLDETALRTAATAARTQAETELAEALAAAGVGSPRGVGQTSATVTEAEDTAKTIARRRAGTEA